MDNSENTSEKIRISCFIIFIFILIIFLSQPLILMMIWNITWTAGTQIIPIIDQGDLGSGSWLQAV